MEQIILSSISLVIMYACFAFSLGNKGIIESFGFENQSNFLYLFLFNALYKPVNFVLRYLAMSLVRKNEYQADIFAVRHGHAKALKEGLVELFKRDKGPLVADSMYSAMNHSQPTLVWRIQAIDQEVKNRR